MVAMVAILAPSCRRPPRGERGARTQSSKRVVIRFAVWGGTEESKIWPRIARAFQARHPKIKVKVEFYPGDYYAKLLTMLAARAAPDCFYLTYERIPAFASRGVLLPLDKFIRKDKELDLTDFFPLALKMFTWRGKPYGLPKGLHTLAVYYNLDLFQSAGLKPPGPNWTWGDYLEIAKRLTKDLDGDGKPEQFGTNLYPFDVAIFQNGGKLVDEKRKLCLLDRPEAVGAVRFCRDLVYKHHVSPPMHTEAGLSHADLFMAGKVAMYVGGTWYLAQFKAIKSFKWGIAPLPKGKVAANIAFGAGVVVWALTKHPREAYLFTKFATSKEGDEISARFGHSIPARKSVAWSAFLKRFPKARVFIDQIRISRLLPLEPWYREVDRIIWEEVEKALSGHVSPEEACRRAARRANEAIRRALAGVKVPQVRQRR